MYFDWLHYASVAGMKNIVQVRWFDKAKVYVSTTDIYNSTANPTSASRIVAVAIPPSTARFWKLRIIGGYTDTDIAGTAYFDGFRYGFAPDFLVTGKTIAEQSAHGENGWYDHGSFVFNLGPLSSNSLVKIDFTAEAKRDTSSTEAGQRFRVGSEYSNEETTNIVTTYTRFYYSMLLHGVSGPITVYQQLRSETTPGLYTYGRKLDGNVKMEILLP
jgi:hypothetical protein